MTLQPPPDPQQRNSLPAVNPFGWGMGISLLGFRLPYAEQQVAKAKNPERQKATAPVLLRRSPRDSFPGYCTLTPLRPAHRKSVALARSGSWRMSIPARRRDFDRLAHLEAVRTEGLFDHDLAGDLWGVSETIEKPFNGWNYGHLSGLTIELYRRLFGGE